MPQPSFNTWTIIFLLGAFQGLFLSAILFFTGKVKGYKNYLLALFLFLFSVTLIEYVLYWTQYIRKFPHMISVSHAFPFLFGVLLYFYLIHVFETRKIKRTDLLHILPFLLCVIFLLPIYLSTANVKREWLQGNIVVPSLFHWPRETLKINAILPWLMIVHMGIYAFLIIKNFHAISRTNREVKTWFDWLSGLFILFIVSFASYYILVNFEFFNRSWDYMISFAMMFFIFFHCRIWLRATPGVQWLYAE